MIKIYEEHDAGRVKVFFVIEDGVSSGVLVGNKTIATKQGIQFYVDDYVAEQIHKFNLVMDGLTPRLTVKDGETLIVPEENDEYKKRKEIEELEERLQELKAE